MSTWGRRSPHRGGKGTEPSGGKEDGPQSLRTEMADEMKIENQWANRQGNRESGQGSRRSIEPHRQGRETAHLIWREKRGLVTEDRKGGEITDPSRREKETALFPGRTGSATRTRGEGEKTYVDGRKVEIARWKRNWEHCSAESCPRMKGGDRQGGSTEAMLDGQTMPVIGELSFFLRGARRGGGKDYSM